MDGTVPRKQSRGLIILWLVWVLFLFLIFSVFIFPVSHISVFLVLTGTFGMVFLTFISLAIYLDKRAKKDPGAAYGFLLPMLASICAGLTGAVFIPELVGQPDRGQLIACQCNIANIKNSVWGYSTDNDGKYPGSFDDIIPEYLKEIPICAAAGKVTYRYNVSDTRDAYTVWCEGTWHKSLVPASFPQYDSINGFRQGR